MKEYIINGKKVHNMFELFEALEPTRNNKTLVETGNGLVIIDAEETENTEETKTDIDNRKG